MGFSGDICHIKGHGTIGIPLVAGKVAERNQEFSFILAFRGKKARIPGRKPQDLEKLTVTSVAVNAPIFDTDIIFSTLMKR